MKNHFMETLNGWSNLKMLNIHPAFITGLKSSMTSAPQCCWSHKGLKIHRNKSHQEQNQSCIKLFLATISSPLSSHPPFPTQHGSTSTSSSRAWGLHTPGQHRAPGISEEWCTWECLSWQVLMAPPALGSDIGSDRVWWCSLPQLRLQLQQVLS